jgi:hypothetical protein
MPSLTWKLIALITLIFAVVVFLWFILLGPLSRCDRLINTYAIDTVKETVVLGGKNNRIPILQVMIREGCLKGTLWERKYG